MKIETLSFERTEEIIREFQVSKLCAKVLSAKGLSNQEIYEILKPAQLGDPLSAYGMKKVVDRIYQAKVLNEKVLVCGDYDADGICSTTIMVDALRRYGVKCGYYIPNRFKEGYGLHVHTVNMAYEKGYRLLITVDNGVKALAALEKAKELGMDVIITDHHALEDTLDCFALLHPVYMGEQFQYLSGAGVALEVSRVLIGDCKEHIVLACVAAIADVMELKKETRAIVKLGIQYLNEGLCLPIQCLANDRYPQWDEMTIAFQVVPKINVTGRLADMANANNTVRYLLMQNIQDIKYMAKQISELNEKRKQMSEDMVKIAKSLVKEEYEFQLLFDDSFHEGMVGLVAGKIAEERKQPVMVVAKNNEHYKGSIRSAGLLDLTTFFDECKDTLQSYGGHKAAAGIGFLVEHKQLIQDYVNNKMKDITLKAEETYKVIPIDLSEMSLAEVQSLHQLAPFGQGFEEPLFYISNTNVLECKKLKQGLHAKWTISDYADAMYFHCGHVLDQLVNKTSLSFIGNLRVQSFMGRKKVNIFVVDAH